MSKRKYLTRQEIDAAMMEAIERDKSHRAAQRVATITIAFVLALAMAYAWWSR